jgi:hypothetical protein
MSIKITKMATPSTPATNLVQIFADIADKRVKSIDDAGLVLNLAQKGLSIINIVEIFTGTVSYTPSVYAKALFVEAVGGGGAGGGAATGSSSCSIGGGGGAGAYSEILITSPKATYTVAVGAGGTAGSAGAAGNAGGDTTFDSPSVCTAKGGNGGAVLAAGTSLVTQLGASGGLAASGVGDLKEGGCDGGWGVRLSASAAQSGEGGAAPIGGGKASGVNATLTAGNAGKNYGGGGSGAMTATTAQVGGVGAPGLLRIWELG